MRFTLLAVSLLAGCYSESDFTPARTTAYCAVVLECTPPEVLAFDGVTAQSCEGVYGPRFQEEGVGCKLRRKEAKLCVQQLELMSCPADGVAIDDSVPPVCGSVFHKCAGAPVPADTDLAVDTGL